MLRSGVTARLLLRPGGIRGPGDKVRKTGQDKPPVGTIRSTARYCMYCTVQHSTYLPKYSVQSKLSIQVSR